MANEFAFTNKQNLSTSPISKTQSTTPDIPEFKKEIQTLSDKITNARNKGFNDTQITNTLLKSNVADRVHGARSGGFNDTQILNTLQGIRNSELSATPPKVGWFQSFFKPEIGAVETITSPFFAKKAEKQIQRENEAVLGLLTIYKNTPEGPVRDRRKKQIQQIIKQGPALNFEEIIPTATKTTSQVLGEAISLGLLATPLPAVKGLKNLSFIQKFLRGGAVGAGFGAAFGLAEEGELKEKLPTIAVMAGAGFLGGGILEGVLPPLLSKMGSGVKTIFNKIVPKKAQDKITLPVVRYINRTVGKTVTRKAVKIGKGTLPTIKKIDDLGIGIKKLQGEIDKLTVTTEPKIPDIFDFVAKKVKGKSFEQFKKSLTQKEINLLEVEASTGLKRFFNKAKSDIELGKLKKSIVDKQTARQTKINDVNKQIVKLEKEKDKLLDTSIHKTLKQGDQIFSKEIGRVEVLGFIPDELGRVSVLGEDINGRLVTVLQNDLLTMKKIVTPKSRFIREFIDLPKLPDTPVQVGKFQTFMNGIKGYIKTTKPFLSDLGPSGKTLGDILDKTMDTISRKIGQTKVPMRKVILKHGFDKPAIVKEVTPTISKELQPLAQEARKYKTAEEFVKALDEGQAGLYVEHTPIKRLLESNIGNDTLVKVGLNPNDTMTVYRGIDDLTGKVKREIVVGDYVATSRQLAETYTGNPKDVVSMEVKVKDFYTEVDEYTKNSIKNGVEEAHLEGVYNPNKPITKSQLTDIYTQATKGVEVGIGKGALTVAEQKNIVDILDSGLRLKATSFDDIPLKPMNDRTRDFLEVFWATTKPIVDESTKLGIKVRDRASGKKYSIGETNIHFPHIPKDMEKFKANLPEIADLMVKRQNMSKQQANAILNDFVKNFATNRYAGLEQRRTFLVEGFNELNKYGYETNPMVALSDFISGAIKRVEEAKSFGREEELIARLIKDIGISGYDDGIAQYVWREYKGDRTVVKTLKDFSLTLRTIQTISKLPFAAIVNSTQVINTAAEFGVKSFSKQLKGYIKNRVSNREFGAMSGVIDETLQKAMEMAGAEAKVAQKFLKNVGFTGVERWNRNITVVTAQDWATNSLDKLLKRYDKVVPNINKLDQKLVRHFDQLGIPNIRKVLDRGRFTQEELSIIGQKAVNSTQFRGSVLDIPLFWSSPQGKVLTQFKSFAWQQGTFIKRIIIDEARQGNVAPFITYMILSQIGGEAVGDIRGILKGDFDFRDDMALWERSIDNFFNVGGFGLTGDLFERMFLIARGQWYISTADMLTGPTFGDITQGLDSIAKAFGGNWKAATGFVSREAALLALAPQLQNIPGAGAILRIIAQIANTIATRD